MVLPVYCIDYDVLQQRVHPLVDEQPPIIHSRAILGLYNGPQVTDWRTDSMLIAQSLDYFLLDHIYGSNKVNLNEYTNPPVADHPSSRAVYKRFTLIIHCDLHTFFFSHTIINSTSKDLETSFHYASTTGSIKVCLESLLRAWEGPSLLSLIAPS